MEFLNHKMEMKMIRGEKKAKKWNQPAPDEIMRKGGPHVKSTKAHRKNKKQKIDQKIKEGHYNDL